jgi:hypothetical protein
VKLSLPNWLWESEASPLSLFSSHLDIDCFTQEQMNDMAQFLGAKEPHSFVVNPLKIYDYAYDTQVDNLFADRFQDNLVHCLLISKLNSFRIIRMPKNKYLGFDYIID